MFLQKEFQVYMFNDPTGEGFREDPGIRRRHMQWLEESYTLNKQRTQDTKTADRRKKFQPTIPQPEPSRASATASPNKT